MTFLTMALLNSTSLCRFNRSWSRARQEAGRRQRTRDHPFREVDQVPLPDGRGSRNRRAKTAFGLSHEPLAGFAFVAAEFVQAGVGSVQALEEEPQRIVPAPFEFVADWADPL